MTLAEIAGLDAATIPDLLHEMEILAQNSGSKAKNYFYQANINPRDHEHLTPAQRHEAKAADFMKPGNYVDRDWINIGLSLCVLCQDTMHISSWAALRDGANSGRWKPLSRAKLSRSFLLAKPPSRWQ